VRALLRLAIAGFVLGAVALAALALLLPRWVESAGFRETLARAVHDQLGRELSYQALTVRLLPPRVEVEALSLSGIGPGAAPAVEAERAALVLDWSGLLRGEAVVDALIIDGARLRITRTAQGLDWIAAALPAAPAGGAGSPSGSEGQAARSSAPIALRSVELRDSELIFDDRVATPAVVWTLRNVDFATRGASLEGPVSFDVSGTLDSGGELAGSGTFALSGTVDADLEVSELSLAPLRSYSDALQELSGRCELRLKIARGDDAALQLDIELSLSDTDLRSDELRLRGALEASAKLAGPVGSLAGPFTVDATQAELDYASGAYRKPAGIAAKLVGTVKLGEHGVSADYELQIRNARGEGSFRSEPSTRLELSTEEFELEGWGELVASVADLGPTGSVALQGFSFSGEPSALGGTIALRAVRLDTETAKPVTVDGFVDARGDTLRFRDLVASSRDASLKISGGVGDVFGAQVLQLRVETPGGRIDANALFSIFESTSNGVYGPLLLDVDVSVPLGSDDVLFDALRGTVRFEIGGAAGTGRITGLSPLRSVFDQFGSVGQAALAVLPIKRGKSLEEYYSEDFLRVAGSFLLRDGRAHTDDLEIIHDTYGVSLQGSLGLSDLTLDMTGSLRIDRGIDRALAGLSSGGLVREISLAHVGGTVSSPRVTLRPEDVSRFASYYLLGSEQGRELARKIDGALGPGASDLLQGVLGALGGAGRSSARETSNDSPSPGEPASGSAEGK
jgi:hypothetical protein